MISSMYNDCHCSNFNFIVMMFQFYIILNLAVGGTNGFFPDGASNPGGKPWSNQSPTVKFNIIFITARNIYMKFLIN